MRKGWAAAAALGLGMFTAAAARAEAPPGELRCEHYANGQLKTEVTQYPATVVVDTYIYNDSATRTYTVTSLFDYPTHSSPNQVDIPVQPGTSTGGTTTFTLESRAQCAALAHHEEQAQTHEPIRLKTFARVRAATGEKVKCVARVVCH